MFIIGMYCFYNAFQISKTKEHTAIIWSPLYVPSKFPPHPFTKGNYYPEYFVNPFLTV